MARPLNGVLTAVRAQRESVFELTFGALERFEHFNQLNGAKDIRIFSRNLEIFGNVDAKRIVHARERLFSNWLKQFKSH